MAFTLAGFSQSLDEGNVYTEIDAIADQHITVSGKMIYVPLLNRLLGVYGLTGSTGTGVLLDAPSLRDFALLDVAPFEMAIISTDNPKVMFFGDNPIPLTTSEGLKALIKADPVAAERHSVLVWLGDASLVPVGGEIHTIRATGTISAVVGTWTNGTLTFSQTLPVGTYRVVGARVEGTNLIAFRFVPIGTPHRPGGIASQDANDIDFILQRRGKMGAWFDFHSTTPPTLDVLAGGTNSAQTIYLDLIKIG